MKTIEFTVSPKEEMSLLNFLAIKLDISKKKAKDLLNARNVFVNRRRIWMARHSLKRGDKVGILQPTVTSGTIDRLAVQARHERFTILFQDDDYIIVDKKAGILSNGMNSVEDHLRAQLGLPHLTAAHRLDRDTSGCFLLAKNVRAFENVFLLFHGRCMKKTYHAIVAGRLTPPMQTIITPLEGRRAVTRIKALDSSAEASHLLVEIETGRTHQIRKHLVSIHHPVLGDKYYGTKTPVAYKTLNIPRQMLHASGLEFDHPTTGRKVKANSPLPRDFCNCLAMFRLM